MNFVKYIFLFVLLLFVLLAFRSGRDAADVPVSEDGFYAMAVSRNIAHGEGLTIDGEHLTNGFQPLFTIISSPLFAGNDKLLAVRLLIIFQVLIFGLTAYLLGKMLYEYFEKNFPGLDASFQWLVSLLYLAGQTVIIKHLNGLETGFYMLMIVATGYYYFRYYKDDLKSRLVLGVLMGLTVLTRIDFAFFVVLFTAAVVFYDKGKTLAGRLQKAFIISFTAFIVSLPWWIYNYAVFGSVMPISGQAQQSFELSAYRVFWAVYAMLNNFEIFTTKLDAVMSHQSIMLFRLVFFAAVAMIALPLFNIIQSKSSTPETARFKTFISVLSVFSLSLVVWYSLTNWAVYFYPRYLMPMVIVSVFILSLAMLKIILHHGSATHIFKILFPVMSVAFLLVLMFKLGMSGSGFLNNQLPLVEKYVPVNERVAAGQTGTLGYFRDNVVNLDGKVNSEALAYRQHMWDYLDNNKISWFCDWQMGVKNFLGEQPEKRGWHFVAQKGDFLLYHKIYK